MALDFYDLAVGKQAFEDGGGDHGMLEEILLVGETFVGGDDGGASLVAVGDELEEQLRLPAVNGKIPTSSNTNRGEIR